MEWRAERKTRPFNPENPQSFDVLAESPEETLARLSRWSVASEAGDLKNLICQLLTAQEQDILRGTIARRWDEAGKGNDAFRTMLQFLKASNWPQPTSLVKVARHLAILPPQTRGIKLAPLWAIVALELRPLKADRITVERHVVNVAGLVADNKLTKFTLVKTEDLYGRKLGCRKKLEKSRGRGSQARLIHPRLVSIEAPVTGNDIYWCPTCLPLYKKPV